MGGLKSPSHASPTDSRSEKNMTLTLFRYFAFVGAMLAGVALQSGAASDALAQSPSPRTSFDQGTVTGNGAVLSLGDGIQAQVMNGPAPLDDCVQFVFGSGDASIARYSNGQYFKFVTSAFDAILAKYRFDKVDRFKAVCVIFVTKDMKLYGSFARLPLDAVRRVETRALDASDLGLAKTGKIVLLKEVYKEAEFYREEAWQDKLKAEFAKYLDDGYLNLTDTFFEMTRREAREKIAAGKDPLAPPAPGKRGVDSRLDDPRLAAPVTETVGGCTFKYPHRMWQMDFDLVSTYFGILGVDKAKQFVLKHICKTQPNGTFQMVDAVPDDGPDSFTEFAEPKKEFRLAKFEYQGCIFDVEFGIEGDEFSVANKFREQCASVAASGGASAGLQNIIFVSCEVTDSMVAPSTKLDIEKRYTGIIIDGWSRGVQMTRVGTRPDWPSSFNYTCSFGEGTKRKACSGTLTVSGTKRNVQVRVPSSCSRSHVQEW